MLDGPGIAHGVDLGALAATSAWMAERLGRRSASRVVAVVAG
jgi:hydroxymethylglutaryl-CoA lyase